eukprot:9578320-Alexandrium_andersonii.AAC.1
MAVGALGDWKGLEVPVLEAVVRGSHRHAELPVMLAVDSGGEKCKAYTDGGADRPREPQRSRLL